MSYTKIIVSTATILAGLWSVGGAWAQAASPAGLWQNIDDQTGRPKALIRITETGGVFSGRIEKLFRTPEENPAPLCVKCDGELKDQPIIGMTILTGMAPVSETGRYEGGQILDPANGKVYRSNMTLIDEGKSLQVRGYIGIPLLGRTQTWTRQP